MNRLQSLSRSAWVALLCVGALGACEVRQGKPTEGCDSIRDCLMDQVCEPIERVCVKEYTDAGDYAFPNTIQGRFSCAITEQGENQAGASLSEVIAVLDEGGNVANHGRWTFSTVFRCSVDGDGQLTVQMMASGDAKGVSLNVDPQEAAKDRAFLVSPNAPYIDPNSLTFFDVATGLVVAYSSSGEVLLSGSPNIGQTIEVYLKASLIPVADLENNIGLGIPCTHGAADCGAVGDAMCLSSIASAPVCTEACRGDIDCVLGGAACYVIAEDAPGMCLRSCVSNNDCEEPFTCQDMGEAQVCL